MSEKKSNREKQLERENAELQQENAILKFKLQIEDLKRQNTEKDKKIEQLQHEITSRKPQTEKIKPHEVELPPIPESLKSKDTPKKSLDTNDNILVKVGNRQVISVVRKHTNYKKKDTTKPLCKILSSSMKSIGEHYTYQLLFTVGSEVFPTALINYSKDMANGKTQELPLEVTVGIVEYNMFDEGETSFIEELITQGKFDKVTLIAIPKESNEGGNDATLSNNCLLNILGVEDPTECSKIKKSIGLKPDDMIPISKIPQLEKLIQCNIMVCNKSYLGCGQYTTNFLVFLVDAHYKLANNATQIKYKHAVLPTNEKRRAFLAVKRLRNNEFLTYSPTRGEEKTEYSTLHVLETEHNYAVWYLPDKRMTPKDAYFLFEKMEGVIHKLTGYSISHCSSFTEAILTYWQYTLPNFTNYQLRETNIINDTFCKQSLKAGLIWAWEKGTYENCSELDFKGFYHGIYKILKFPTTHGTWGRSEDFEGKPLEYGLYEVEISNEECNKEEPPRFRHASVYTHYEIEAMRKHHYEHKLVGRCRVFAKSSLKPLLRTFGTKLEGFRDEVPETKKFVNMLYGILTQHNYEYQKCNKGEGIKACHVKEITTSPDYKRITVKGNLMDAHEFKHLPIIGVMITSYGRCLINEAMDKVGRDNILRVQTDGFILQGKFDKKILGSKIGDLVLKKEGEVNIHHVNKCVWNGEEKKIEEIEIDDEEKGINRSGSMYQIMDITD